MQAVTEPRRGRAAGVDLRPSPTSGGRGAEAAGLHDEATRTFDLATGPLWRARLLRLAAAEHVLLLTLHHIVTDGWSMEVLVREVGALYAASRAGSRRRCRSCRCSTPTTRCGSGSWLAGEVLDGQLGYWRGRLAGAPALLELPTDRPRPPVESLRGGLSRWC